ncbi:uncharacterized protein LOC134198031 [Corticium candelabrum]|uniref:uncharacterized protein LOC134198031 n=1 Tax=Corticium candelabrum TaxID=121492 RepID=UPI002E2554E3|nr:uncharacterized protein LOC134198031 [Corticium candelabrum]
MDGRPPSPTEGLPVSDDLYLVVDDKSSAVAHQPVVHTPSDSYVIFTDGSRQSGVPETEDVYLAAYEGERRAPNVKEGARLSRSPTPKKLGIPVPVTKPKAFTLGGAMVDELKRELNSGLLEEDDFYQNLPGRAMTDVHNLQQERRAANRNSGLHPQTSGYEAGGGRDLYENLRRQPISDVKSHSQPQQVSQPPLQMEEIYGNQEVVDMSNMPPTLDVIYGNSDLIEEQVYANT